MKTISIKLPGGLDSALAALARRRRTSKSAVVRAALEQALTATRSRAGSALDRSGDLVGCVAGPDDLSVNTAYLSGLGR